MSALHLLWIIPLSAFVGFMVCALLPKTASTNADRFRAMSDMELAKFLIKAHDCELHIPFCQEKQECCDDLEGIQDESCLACMMAWLNREVGE